MTLRKILAISELLLACAFGLGVLIFFVSMSNISTPTWQLQFFLYWGAMTSGPLLLVIGASLTLFDVALKRAAMIMALGSGILSCWAVYLVIGLFEEMARRSPDRRSLATMTAIFCMVLLSDFAAYKSYGLVAKTS
jgi:hypothetical protein